ncbi:MAG TPA: NIPSNAP family protein [Parafilimonas sp.]|nr:NIPSNAP family protein [Parafilimonas sp.]
MKKHCILFTVLALLCISAKSFSNEIYQITVYHFKNPQQEITLDTYLQTAYLPALHRKQIKNIGVFKPIANDTATDKIIYVIIPFKSLNDMQALQTALDKDAIYAETGKDYLTASYQNPPYVRMEKILLSAFELASSMNLPKLNGDKKEHVYELRSYESPTENYYKSKVKMFNAGNEIGIFKKLNFNAVFYADVVAGSRMPNLMYLTSFENMSARDAHWKTFGDDPAWKNLSSMDEYKNNVSKADIILMHAASYSDY